MTVSGRALAEFLERQGFDFFAGVPCSLIEDLIAFATQPQFVYQHRWAVGDLVIWDNRCTMHRGRPYDDTQRRVLHRTTVSDIANTLEQEGLAAISPA